MRRGTILLLICVALVLVTALIIQRSTRAQAGPPRRAGMLTQLLPLESSWSYLCFELDVTDKQLPDIRKIYKESWNNRKKLIAKAAKSVGDRDAMAALRPDAEKLKADLDSKLKGVLTAEQLKKLAERERELLEQARQASERLRDRRRRP